MRRLLPYEHQLAQHLGVTAEDYLTFLAMQQDFTLSPEEKLEEPQAAVATVALVLTIVGTILQVASALLAPKPEQQRTARNQRDQVFAPRFGFNSTQELAKYGDTVNLVYTNATYTDENGNVMPGDNPNGGVRVNTSLVWSAVRSFGTSQYMQMLAVIAAGPIGAIDQRKSAFGQTPVRQFVSEKTWSYFNASGLVFFKNQISGDGNDPARKGNSQTLQEGDPVNQINLIGDERRQGFSQSFSPSTLNRFGIFAPIPINVDVEIRDKDGNLQNENNEIVVLPPRANGTGLVGTTPDYWPNFDSAKNRPNVPKGTRFVLRFRQIDKVPNDSEIAADRVSTANDARRAAFSSIDSASLYKLGSAKFRIVSIVDTGNGDDFNNDIEDSNVDVTFECIEEGRCPREDYKTQRYSENEAEAKQAILELQAANAVLETQLAENDNRGPAIFLPELLSTTDELQSQINGLNETIENYRSFRNDDPEREKLRLRDLEANSVTDPIVKAIIDEINELEDKLEDLREIENPTDAQKKKKRETKKAIKQAERRLKKAIFDYGTIFSVDNNNQNIRQAIKDVKKILTQKTREMGRFQNNSAYWDLTAMASAQATRRAQIASNNVLIADAKRDLRDPNELNDYFNTKCLVKIEEAAYSTITPCKVVDFALKAKVFKRVQGRSKLYGETEEDEYKDSDNGAKYRSFYFWLLYRNRTGNPDATWVRVPKIFVVRRTADLDNFISLKFIASNDDGGWEFKFEPIAETAAEMTAHGFVAIPSGDPREFMFAYLENSGRTRTIDLAGGHIITFTGTIRKVRDQFQSPLNQNPIYLDEWGLFSLRSDTQCQFSFDQGPEMSIVAVTEQRQELFTTYPKLYDKLSMMAFHTYSGQGIQDLRSLSVYVTKGKLVSLLRDDGTYDEAEEAKGPSSYIPDIFLDTVLDSVNGIGQFAKKEGLDLKALALAKKFCRQNGFFFDGVIAQQTPWRQFWAEVAPFSLLELARVGGKETLVPAVPCEDGFLDIDPINPNPKRRRVNISGLYTAGNILEDSYKEDFLDYGSTVQDLIATVIYRETKADETFPRNNSIEVRLADAIEGTAVRQTFDLSQYVTSRSQAEYFGKLLCNQRRFVRRAIEFRTFPSATFISPGSYIYVSVGQNQWQNIHSGRVETGGALNTPVASNVPNGTYNVLLYKPGEPKPIALSNVTVSGNTASALADRADYLFVLGNAVTDKRVFRVVEVTMDEEGEVGVKAVEHPCQISGNETLSKIAYLLTDALKVGIETIHPGFTVSLN